MKSPYAAGRRNLLIAFVIVAVAIAGYMFIATPWLAKRAADQRASQTRDAAYRATVRCVEVKGSLRDFLLEDSKLTFAGSTCTLNAARLASTNSAAYDAAVARCEYETRQARILHATALCERWVACDKTHSQKAAFDSCYGLFGPNDNDDDDAADDRGDAGDSSDP
jgi:hypothetical protein